jgi:hypothetical protein
MLADHTLASAFNSRSNSAVKNYGNVTIQPTAGASIHRPARLNGGIILEANNYSGKVSRPKSAHAQAFGIK